MSAIHMNNHLFQEAVNQSRNPVLVDFWAPWCTYCRRIEPAYERVAEQYAGSLVVAKVNIDDEPLLAQNEQIEVIPTLVLYHNGKAVGSIVAPESKAMIDSFIRQALDN